MTPALITGASRGPGDATARRRAAEGWTVFAGCRAPESAGKTLSELDPSPGPDTAALDIRPLSLDVTDDALHPGSPALLAHRDYRTSSAVVGIRPYTIRDG